MLLRMKINPRRKYHCEYAALLFGYVQDSFTAGTLDFIAFEIGWDFEFQPAQAGQEGELIYLSHNVVDLAHLGFAAFFLFGFFAGLAHRDVFFGEGGDGYDRFGFCYGTKGVGVVFEGGAMGHIAQNSYSFRNGRVGAGQVGELSLAFFLERICNVHWGRNFIGTGQLRRRVIGDFFQGAGEALGVACQTCGAGVGQILTFSGECKIQQVRHYWGENRSNDCDDEHNKLGLASSFAAGRGPSAASAHRAVEHTSQEHLGEQDDGAKHYSGQRYEENVTVQDVTHLVCDDALELISV